MGHWFGLWGLLLTAKRTGVVCRRNTCILLPDHKPSTRRLEHLVSEQPALLGGLSASRLEQLGPQETARLEGPFETVPLATSPQHCQHPSFPREELKALEIACPF